MPALHVQSGDDEVRVIEIADRATSVGRADDNDVVLAEQKASRRHCTFRPFAGGWRVVDEQSSNGTWLGGKPVLAARLQPGDEIEIGETVITFVAQPAEQPPRGLVRARRSRKIRMPWEALAGAAFLAAVCWFAAGALAGDQSAREAAAWRRNATAVVARVSLGTDPYAFGPELARAEAEFASRPGAADAVTIVRGAAARGFARPTDTAKPEWTRALEQAEASRSRMSASERRARLREILARHGGDARAVEAVATLLVADEAATRENAERESARLLAEADAAVADGRLGVAFDDWADWLAKAPVVEREAERAVAAKMKAARDQARIDAGAALAQYEEQLKEGRLAAAAAVVDGALERLRGTGYDAWLGAKTRRYEGSGGTGGTAGAPTTTGPRETDSAREKRLAAERVQRARRTADALAGRRRFADAAVALGEAAAAESDPAAQAEMKSRAEDLSSAAEVLAAILGQVREGAARFGSIPYAAGGRTGALAGATDTALLVVESKGAAPRTVEIEALPTTAFAALVERAALEPASFVSAALVLREVGEFAAYTAWMRKALAVDALRMDASFVHARATGAKTPDGGYFPHPTDASAIVTADELKRIQNAGLIAAKAAELVRAVEKIEASKQAKQVESVAAVHAKLEAARNHALELIFDEAKYFYPYRDRMKEYMPVQREVDVRVKAVRELWEEKVSAKVRTDAALEKLLKQADDLCTDIGFYGGDVTALSDRVERVRRYLGRELTVQSFFVTKEDLELDEYNREMLAANAKLKGDISEPEREQVRITNEYRRMMGHRRMLRIHEKLVAAARGHSEDMSKVGFFDHMSPVPGKHTPWDRMQLAGYPNQPCSENIAAGSGDAQSAHDSWCHSSGHHRNLLMKDWSEMGSGQSGRYWTQNFGFANGDERIGGASPSGQPR